MSMSIKDFFDRCCLILAAIPILGFLLYYFFDYDELASFCLVPRSYLAHYYGDGALEFLITIPIEICLCIYCLIAFRHKIFDVEFYKRNKKWFFGALLAFAIILIFKNIAAYPSSKKTTFIYDTENTRVQIKEFSDKSILTDTTTGSPKSSVKYILSGDTIFVAGAAEIVEVGCPETKYCYYLLDSLVIEGDYVKSLSLNCYVEYISVKLDKK